MSNILSGALSSAITKSIIVIIIITPILQWTSKSLRFLRHHYDITLIINIIIQPTEEACQIPWFARVAIYNFTPESTGSQCNRFNVGEMLSTQ